MASNSQRKHSIWPVLRNFCRNLRILRSQSSCSGTCLERSAFSSDAKVVSFAHRWRWTFRTACGQYLPGMVPGSHRTATLCRWFRTVAAQQRCSGQHICCWTDIFFRYRHCGNWKTIIIPMLRALISSRRLKATAGPTKSRMSAGTESVAAPDVKGQRCRLLHSSQKKQPVSPAQLSICMERSGKFPITARTFCGDRNCIRSFASSLYNTMEARASL